MTSTVTKGDSFSSDFPELLVRHVDHLLSCAISPEVIRERGYRSILRCAADIAPTPGHADLGMLGFKQTQMLLPAILMPLYGVDGRVVLHQLRPDSPRINQGSGKPVKYETPAKRNMHLDIPPRCHPSIGDPTLPLFVTEGIKKGDSLASAGACVTSLLGVYNWRGTNEQGGKVALPEWESVALNGRLVYIVFDSDIVDKPAVKGALERLAKFLALKGAIVKIVRLPPGKDKAKTGVDDFLAQGHSLEEVVGLAETPKEAKVKGNVFADQYEIQNTLIMVNRYDRDGTLLGTLPCSNFGAKIVAEIVEDDDLRQRSYYRIIGQRENGALLPTVQMLPVDEFPSLSWVETNWKTRAIISAHPSAKAQIVQAIKINSQDVKEERIFKHAGWREIDGKMVYLTNGGAIGASGITVSMDSDLRDYELPQLEDCTKPDGQIKPLYRDAFAASLDFLNMGTHRITLPLWAAMYMCPLNPVIDTCFTLFLVAGSGKYKSSISSLALNHYGPNFAYNRLPGSWTSTDNKLEYNLHLMKDAPYLIDDYAPGADPTRARLLAGLAERVIRAQGNRSGRGRMTKDITGRVTPIPRGFLITSGELLPGGMSHNARIFTLHLTDLDVERAKVRAVTAETKKLYGYAMTQYIGWLAGRWEELKNTLPQHEKRFYDQAERVNKHARTPASVAKLYAGLAMGLQFMVSNGSIPQKEAGRLGTEGFQILMEWAAIQAERIETLSPANRFIESLISLINSGQVEFRAMDEESPPTPRPGVRLIGWKDENRDYLLNPNAAFNSVRSYCSNGDDPLTIGEEAVWRDLRERNMTICSKGRNKYNAYIYGRQTWVVKVRREVIDGEQVKQGAEVNRQEVADLLPPQNINSNTQELLV